MIVKLVDKIADQVEEAGLIKNKLIAGTDNKDILYIHFIQGVAKKNLLLQAKYQI